MCCYPQIVPLTARINNANNRRSEIRNRSIHERNTADFSYQYACTLENDTYVANHAYTAWIIGGRERCAVHTSTTKRLEAKDDFIHQTTVIRWCYCVHWLAPNINGGINIVWISARLFVGAYGWWWKAKRVRSEECYKIFRAKSAKEFNAAVGSAYR